MAFSQKGKKGRGGVRALQKVTAEIEEKWGEERGGKKRRVGRNKRTVGCF